MTLKRREFILTAGRAAAGTALLSGVTAFKSSHLQPMTGDIAPITLEERLTRIEKARRLMVDSKIEALLLDCGTSMQYFTGVSWWPSERTMVAVFPARGDPKYVGPAFEAERLRELIKIGTDIRVWEEHESPYKQIANVFKDMGIR